MMSMAFKEGVSFPPAALNKVIVAANQDIRQVSLYCYSALYCCCCLLLRNHGFRLNFNTLQAEALLMDTC